MTARHALGAALLIAFFACKKSGNVPLDARPAPSAPASSEASAALVGESNGPVVDAGAPDVARASASRKAITQEDVFDQATQQVRAAAAEANEKKPDCDKIADLLDVSFATVGPEMSVDDRPVFATFAACAKKARRWRLLRAVTDAIILGDASQKTTYYLPRALIGSAQYDAANRLSSAALRSWPKEG
jgi:hypothetical protein